MALEASALSFAILFILLLSSCRADSPQKIPEASATLERLQELAQAVRSGDVTQLTELGDRPEEALAHFTTAFHGLLSSVTSGTGAGAGASAARMFQDMLQQQGGQLDSLQEALAEVATQTWGKLGNNMLRLGKDAKLRLNLGSLLGDLAKGAGQAKSELQLDLQQAVQRLQQQGLSSIQDTLEGLQKSLSADYSGSMQAFVKQAKELSNSALTEALLTPGARLVDRVQQLGKIFADVTGYACSPYFFSPGGASSPATWTGPSFTLTQATGSCALIPELRGIGNSGWTRAVQRLTCLGGAMQHSFSPIGYSGPATDAERLVTPECKVVRKFGQEVEITLYGGDDNAPIRFDSEAHLFAAMLTNKTFDFHLRGAKTFLKSVQAKLDNGQTLLSDILRIGSDGSQGGDQAAQGMAEGLASLLKSGTIMKQLDEQAAGMHAQLLAHLQQRAGDQAASGKAGSSWMRKGAGFDAAAYWRSVQDKLAKGDFVFKGAGQPPAPVSADA